MTYHLRLKNAMSYTGVVNATREEPDVFTADEAIKAAALRSGYFDLSMFWPNRTRPPPLTPTPSR